MFLFFTPTANQSPSHVHSISLIFLQYAQDSLLPSLSCSYRVSLLDSDNNIVTVLSHLHLLLPIYAPATVRVILLKASLIRSHPV